MVLSCPICACDDVFYHTVNNSFIMGKVISTLKGPCMGERGTEELQLTDVAVGRKELGYQYALMDLNSNYSRSNNR